MSQPPSSRGKPFSLLIPIVTLAIGAALGIALWNYLNQPKDITVTIRNQALSIEQSQKLILVETQSTVTETIEAESSLFQGTPFEIPTGKVKVQCTASVRTPYILDWNSPQLSLILHNQTLQVRAPKPTPLTPAIDTATLEYLIEKHGSATLLLNDEALKNSITLPLSNAAKLNALHPNSIQNTLPHAKESLETFLQNILHQLHIPHKTILIEWVE